MKDMPPLSDIVTVIERLINRGRNLTIRRRH